MNIEMNEMLALLGAKEIELFSLRKQIQALTRRVEELSQKRDAPAEAGAVQP